MYSWSLTLTLAIALPRLAGGGRDLLDSGPQEEGAYFCGSVARTEVLMYTILHTTCRRPASRAENGGLNGTRYTTHPNVTSAREGTLQSRRDNIVYLGNQWTSACLRTYYRRKSPQQAWNPAVDHEPHLYGRGRKHPLFQLGCGPETESPVSCLRMREEGIRDNDKKQGLSAACTVRPRV